MPNAQNEVTRCRRAHYKFLTGAAVGMVEVLCTYPLDVVKCRLQVQGTFRVPSRNAYSGAVNAVVLIYRHEGLPGFWRGIVPQVCLDTPKRGIKFFLYDQVMQLVQLGPEPSPLNHAASGAMAGLLESFLMNPFEVVKVTQQVHQEKHLRTLPMIRYIIKRDGYGIEGLYRGITALIARNTVYHFTFFGVYNAIKGWLPTAQHSGSEILRKMAIAGFSGALGCSLCVIFDVAKCRIQAPQPVRGVVKYRWTIQTLRTIYQEEGLRAMYKGLTPMLMRGVPGGAMLMVSYEAFYDFLIRRHENKNDAGVSGMN